MSEREAMRMARPAADGRSCCSTMRVYGESFGYVSVPGEGRRPAVAAPSEKCVAGMSIWPECACTQSKCIEVASRQNLKVEATSSEETSSTSRPCLPRHAAQRFQCSTSEKKAAAGVTSWPVALSTYEASETALTAASMTGSGRLVGAMKGRS